MNMRTLPSRVTPTSVPATDRDLLLTDRPRVVDGVSVSLVRRLAYRVWPLLPSLGRRLVFRLTARRTTLGACAVIGDSRGRVLVAHHTYRRRAWGLPGGLVGKHEQPHAALERELGEELGTAARVGSLLHVETEGGHLTLYYRATIVGVPRPDGVEIDQFRYVSPAELITLTGRPAPQWLIHVGERQAS
jgi:8-oxo-dGTP pyrophosphatase MutT (NUDIX family)